MLRGQLAGNRLAQSRQIVKAKLAGQIIINSGLALFVNFLDRTFKYSFFAGKVGGLILFREGDFHIHCLPGFSANQTIFKARDKAV